MSAIVSPALAAGLTSAVTFQVEMFERVMIQVSNGNVAALTGFVIKGKASADAPYHVLLSSTAHYSTPAGVNIGAGKSTDGTAIDFNVLGTNASGWIILNVKGIDSIDIQASSAGAAVLTFYIRGR